MIQHVFTHSPCPRAGVAQHTRPSRTTKASPAHLGPMRCLRGHFLARLSAPRRYFIFAADSTQQRDGCDFPARSSPLAGLAPHRRFTLAHARVFPRVHPARRGLFPNLRLSPVRALFLSSPGTQLRSSASCSLPTRAHSRALSPSLPPPSSPLAVLYSPTASTPPA